MTNIVDTAVRDNEYLGMVKVDLKLLWDGPAAVSPKTYNIYKNMCQWLSESKITHRFFWDNTGQYLPNAIYLDAKSDTATYFMLKYGICR